MTLPNPTKEEADQIRVTLATSRAGRASLGQIASACEVADRSGLPACAQELREHARRQLGVHHQSVGRDLVLGLVSGGLTHFLLRGI